MYSINDAVHDLFINTENCIININTTLQGN